MYIQSYKKLRGKKSLKAQKGFTIVELLIAMTLFTVLIGITSGAFIQSLRTQKNLTALIAANSNASITIEQIAREARTGKDFCIGANSPCIISAGVYKELIFTNAKNEKVKYELIAPSIMRSINSQTPIPVTADNVNMQILSFYIDGNQPGDGKNARITMVLKVGAAGIPFSESVINLQTTVTTRILKD